MNVLYNSDNYYIVEYGAQGGYELVDKLTARGAFLYGDAADRFAQSMKDAVAAELLQHATEELAHADLVANRIIQLGGKPLTEPKLWYEWSGCGYLPPDDEYVKKILEQNIHGEQCAISTYDKLLKTVEGKDIVTYNLVTTILEQEVEHEEDLQSLLEDLELLVSRGMK